jgi:hypothetical protein
MMRSFLAAVLSVIAVGVLLIAYGLLNPRAAQVGAYQTARPILANERVGMIEDAYGRYAAVAQYPAPAQYPAYVTYPDGRAMAYPVNEVRQVPVYETYPAQRVVTAPRVIRTSPAHVERRSGRDWQKTAMVIGGTTAAGAGLGAIFGGKKGALIGAAIGGGAGTLYEVRKR